LIKEHKEDEKEMRISLCMYTKEKEKKKPVFDQIYKKRVDDE
jgi:hypothetical protein